jgi:hypothetical protein
VVRGTPRWRDHGHPVHSRRPGVLALPDDRNGELFAQGDSRRDITTGDPHLVLTLCREHISSDVQLEDLLWPYDVAKRTPTGWRLLAFAGEYNEFNRWTTTDGAMHLTHRSNTLQVSSINVAALSEPAAWTPIRGSAAEGKILRARIDVPPGGMQVGGVPLEYGGQVAEHIQMILTGLVNDAADGSPLVRNCVTTCCTHPNRASFRTVVDPQDDCANIAWSSLAPFLPAEPGVPGLALTDAAAEADIPAPAEVPEGVEIQPRGTASSARR